MTDKTPRFTEAETEFVRAHWGTLTAKDIAAQLQRSIPAVRMKALKMGLIPSNPNRKKKGKKKIEAAENVAEFDSEAEAFGNCVSMLTGLQPDAQKRVVKYLETRFCTD